MKMNPVVHFEMPAEERDRMAKFYEKAFGWKLEKYGPEMGNYVVATTTELDPKTERPKMPGAINGGFYPKSKDNVHQQHPSVVIAVDDIKKHIKIVTDAGGKMINEPVEIPEVGMYASFIDTEGNTVSMLQPKM